MTGKLLEIDGLEVHFTTRRGVVRAVRGVSLSIGKGEALGLVGESGSGKSVTAQAAMGLVHAPGEIVGGDIRWKGKSLLGPRGQALSRKIRGRKVSIVFQDAMTSLNPLFTCGQQIAEVLRHHMGMNRKQARARALELLELVDISAPQQRLDQFPFEMSGGMRQRVMIAMALTCEPELLIADEPTTALDVNIQAQILELLQDLQQRLGLSIIMITHDLGVVAGICDRVAVMYGGRIVEQARVDEIFARPGHPYTMGLLRSTPRIDGGDERMTSIAGSPPDLLVPQSGCAFAERCPVAQNECATDIRLKEISEHRQVACHFPFEGPWSRNAREAGGRDGA